MSDRLRLVVMGDSYVGKSSIVKRFLFDTFPEEHHPTVEDLYNRDYDISGHCLKVDILDTAGDAQFPAMRRLSIASAHAFLLVYSVTDPISFVTVKQRYDEIREQRADFQDIPIVFAGNKADMVSEVETEDIESWVRDNLPRQRTCVIECSARQGFNVTEIFKTFLLLAKIYFASPSPSRISIPISPASNLLGVTPVSSGLRRNLSAYGRLKSCKNDEELGRAANSQMNHEAADRQGSCGAASLVGTPSPQTSPREFKFLGFNFTPMGSPTLKKNIDRSPEVHARRHVLPISADSSFMLNGGAKKEPKRSRSLIRRSSRKAKQQIQNLHSPEDCVIS